MGFLAPAFLAGVLFAGIPVVIHLIHRRRSPQVIFAATRFLKIAARRTARKRRIDNMLLLILRTLILALLAIGLAAPVLKRAVGAGRRGTDVVIILDNSLSMSAGSDGGTRFTKAKEAASAVLSNTGASDLVALVSTAAPDSLAATDFAADVTELRGQLQRMAASKARGNSVAALDTAASLLADSAAPAKIVYVITDLQAGAFASVESLADFTRAALLDVPVIIYDCGGQEPRNLAVTAVNVKARGAVRGAPLEIVAGVSSTSPAPETVAVSLSAGQSRLARRTVTIAPGGTTEVSLAALAGEPGVMKGFVEVETQDALAEDNRRHFAAIVRERIRVLILVEKRVTPAFDDDAFFLERALNPFKTGSDPARSPFDVDVMSYGDECDLDDYDVVCVMLRGGLPGPRAVALERYAAAGGCVILFALESGREGLSLDWLPAELVTLRSADRSSGESFAVSSLDTSHPATSEFSAEPPALYNTVRVYDYWLSIPDPERGVVLARFEGGDPAVVVSGKDSLRTAVFTTAPTRRMGNLASSQLFLPLVHELIYHLLSITGGAGEVSPGGAVTLLPRRGAAEVVVTGPDSSSHVLAAGADGTVSFTGTHALGIYEVSDSAGESPRHVFSVNADPEESDLRSLDADRAGEFFPGSPLLTADSLDSLEEAVSSLEGSLAFGDMLLYSVLALAVMECLAANRIPRTGPERK